MTQFEVLEVIENAYGWISTNQIAKKLKRTPTSINRSLTRVQSFTGMKTKLKKVKGYVHKFYKFIKPE